MNRQEKVTLVEQLKSQFSDAQSSLLVNYQGLTVHQLQQLRRGVTAQGGTFKVAKARLLKKAADQDNKALDLIPYFRGQVGIVFVTKDEQTPAVLKFLHDFSKKNEALSMVVGSMDSKIIDKAVMARLATLPSREVLLAMICGALKGNLNKLVSVLKQISEKKAVVTESVE